MTMFNYDQTTTITLHGTSPTVVLPPTNYCGCGQWSLLSAQTARANSGYQEVTGYSPSKGAQVSFSLPTGGVFVGSNTYTNGAWAPSAPALTNGEAAFFFIPCLTNLPDLAVASVSWTGPPVAGQSFVVSLVVTNVGGSTASGGWVDEFVLSTSTSVTDAVPNVTLQFCNVSHSVAPNGSYTNTQTWTLLGAPSGQYYLIGVADVFNNLAEANEGNNILAVPITLAIPDLGVTSVTFTGQAVAGQPLAVSMDVTNLGSGFANGSWYDEFVLSTSPALADAVPNGTFNFNLGH